MINKKSKLALAFVALSCMGVQAQIDNYNLETFKLRDVNYQKLDVGFNLRNAERLSFRENTDQKNTSKSASVFSGFSGGYSNVLFKDKIVSSSYISGNAYASFLSLMNDNASGKNTIRENNSYTRISLRNSTDYYVFDNSFVRVNPYFRLSNDRVKQVEEMNNADSTLIRNGLNSEGGIYAGFGFGRLEPVDYAMKALYILKDLRTANVLNREPSADEITQIAENIAKNQYRRFYDGRLEIIEQLSSLDSLLSTMGLIKQTNAAYFTTIYDNWLYANNNNRSSGYRIHAGPLVDFDYSKKSNEIVLNPGDSTRKTSIGEKNMILGASLSGTYSKPINHFWQRDISASFYYQIKDVNDISDVPSSRNFERVEMSLIGRLDYGYYPNTRTFIRAGVDASWLKYDKTYTEGLEDKVNDNSLLTGGSVDGFYYFSPRLRVNFSGSIRYDFLKTGYLPNIGGSSYVKSNGFYFEASAGLAYSFF
jgi:hypothetical protein